MFKRILFATALFSSAAVAQQVDVNGKDFLSGAGDARLADIARQAASQGKRLTVTAPDYWQSKVAAKLRAGASNIDVQMKEGFFENVLVRVDDSKAPPVVSKPDTAAADTKAAAKADAARAEAKAEAARVEAARIESERAEAQRAQAARDAADRAEMARIEAQKAEAARAETAKAEAARADAAKAAAAKAKAEKDAADKLAAIRQRMEQNLNGGHAAEGEIRVSQLQKDDQVFIDEPIRGVIRRAGARTQLFWLEGDLNVDRVELLPVSDNHYKVSEAIRENATPVLRTKTVGGHFVANVPAPDSPDRKQLEQQYADEKPVSETIRPEDLRSGDAIYTAKSAAIVVRLAGGSYLRYWLDGDLNLGQSGLQKQGNGYRVISDTIR